MPPSSINRHANQQTVSWLRDLYRRGLLDMEPPYQRKSVWNLAFRQYFVETVLLQYPSPAVFLYRSIDESTGTEAFAVVDGKQRLETLFRFSDDEFAISEKSELQELRGKVFSQLEEYRAAFWNYQLTIEFIPTVEENVLNSIFDRINRNTIRLTPQELRHAKYSGRFIAAAERLAEYVVEVSPDVPRIVAQSRQQMKDVEFIADLLLLLEEGPKGHSISDLDQAFSDRDEEWEDETLIERRFRAAFELLNRIFDAGVDVNLRTSRLRNQADYYSLFGAVDELLENDVQLDIAYAGRRLSEFVRSVDDQATREEIPHLAEYYNAARSASNDTGPRRQRIEILKTVFLSPN